MIETIRGKQLYYEDLGGADAPPLLYLHGGPGGIGAVDFVWYQGETLARRFRLIAPDQRGVWRSEAIAEHEAIELEDIVDDFEELRKQLRIPRWSLLSHSFGGYLAVLYAARFPDAIERIVFENPSFGFALSERYLLQCQAERLEQLGYSAAKYQNALQTDLGYPAVSVLLAQVNEELGGHAEDTMWCGPDKRIVENLAMGSENAGENWQKSLTMRRKVLNAGRVYQDVFSLLSAIRHPCLLLKGNADPITCSVQIDTFLRRVPHAETAHFEKSGHWIHIEEPQCYAEIVTEFLTKEIH